MLHSVGARRRSNSPAVTASRACTTSACPRRYCSISADRESPVMSTPEPRHGKSPRCSLHPARVHGGGPAFEATVPVLIPRVALIKSHFGARQCRADTLTGQCVVLGSCLAHPTVVAVRFRCRRVDFLPRDVAPMTVLVGVDPNLIRVLPEHPCALGVGRRRRGEQGESE